jgi:microcompartment protein CcmK/EutM
MKFARVHGTVVATRKYEGLEGVKFLVVGSREAAQAMPVVFVPVDLAITGIIDEVEVERGARRAQPTAAWHVPPSEDED